MKIPKYLIYTILLGIACFYLGMYICIHNTPQKDPCPEVTRVDTFKVVDTIFEPILPIKQETYTDEFRKDLHLIDTSFGFSYVLDGQQRVDISWYHYNQLVLQNIK